MLGVFDTAEHVGAAGLTYMTLDGLGRIEHAELVAVLRDLDLVFRHDRDHREQYALRSPAQGAAADMVVRDLRADRYLDGLIRALAGQGASREVLRSLLDAVVD